MRTAETTSGGGEHGPGVTSGTDRNGPDSRLDSVPAVVEDLDGVA